MAVVVTQHCFNLERRDAFTADPRDAQQIEGLGPCLRDAQVNDAIRPPISDIVFRAVSEALANEPL